MLSTPWPLFNRPSIQLGTLKAFLSKGLPGVRIRSHHVFLHVAAALGYPLYQKIAQSTWLAEPLYGALLYPGQSRAIEKSWRRLASRGMKSEGLSFPAICKELEKASLEFVSQHDWEKYLLIGFSICFSQLTSSLYFIKKIRDLAPRVPIVVGGSSVAGDLGKTLLKTFPEITYLVEGEGELPLLRLTRQILQKKSRSNHCFQGRAILKREQVEDMDLLPTPDYDDYFEMLASLGPSRAFTPRLPVEMSRGCWWNKCAFCNLNLQWKGYRAKGNERMLLELLALARKHQVLGFSFVDNLLPPKDLMEFFREISRMDVQLELFSEIRATTPPEMLRAMGRAGMKEVQVGIEALSTRLLQKLHKGTTAMDNIEIMKNCEHPGCPRLTGNLIMEFPGSDPHDVEETLTALDFVLPFSPLKAIPFWLGYGSPVWSNPRQYKIKKVFNHPRYKGIFPEGIFNSLLTMIQGYHGGLQEQKKLWRPVREKVKQWTAHFEKAKASAGSDPILSYLDGGDFIIIRKWVPAGYPETHKLKGTSRKIYLFCETRRSIQEIVAYAPSFTSHEIEGFLAMMVEKRLMFREKDNYIALAVPVRPTG